MKISTKLKLAALAPVLMALVIGVALLLSSIEMEQARERRRAAQRVMNSMYELNTLAHFYMLYHEQRPKRQFLLEYDATRELLSTIRFKHGEMALLSRITENSEAMKNSFLKLASTYERHGTEIDTQLLGEAEERLAGSLIARSRDVLSDAVRLESLIAEDITVTQSRIDGFILALIIATTVPLTIVLLRMMIGISTALAALRTGTQVIGDGNLDHRIGMTAADEIGELSRSFDQMAEQLKKTTVSRDALSKEVDDRTRAEEELKMAYGRLQTFFDHRIGGIGIVIANAEGNIIQANDYYLNILGCSREELLGGQVDWRRVTPPEWLPADEIALDQLRRRGVCNTYEKEYLRRDGSRVPVLITDVMMREDSDKILAFILDITERKQAELALQTAHDELANQVEERTRELHEKEVMLKEIHHRVKNNLQVICSLVGLQADSSQDKTVRAVLSDVTDRVRSMALVHEKLYQSSDLSRIDFGEYARGLLGYLWRAHGDAAAAVRLTLDLESVALPIDTAVPCGLILNELAGNALKHAFPGRCEGEVTVSLRESVDGRICLCVDDNGVGLPAGFDWRQAQSLGLHLVQLLSRQLDAEVEFSGGEGTRFALVFGYPGSQN